MCFVVIDSQITTRHERIVFNISSGCTHFSYLPLDFVYSFCFEMMRIALCPIFNSICFVNLTLTNLVNHHFLTFSTLFSILFLRSLCLWSVASRCRTYCRWAGRSSGAALAPLYHLQVHSNATVMFKYEYNLSFSSSACLTSEPHWKVFALIFGLIFLQKNKLFSRVVLLF